MTEISQYFFPCAEFSVLPFVLYEEKVVAYQEPAPKNPFYVPWRRLFSLVATNVNGPNTTAKKIKPCATMHLSTMESYCLATYFSFFIEIVST